MMMIELKKNKAPATEDEKVKSPQFYSGILNISWGPTDKKKTLTNPAPFDIL